jgi:glycosyltransferase involved in cell wall biosynthesis
MTGISVIIPVYNRANLLPATLRSLLAQTVPAGEILVVDDGSTDGSAEVAESFGATVRVIRQANAGPGAARNRGFAESRGEYIHFFDSDDLALPNKHEVQLAALERSGADIAYGPWVKGRIGETSFNAEGLVLQQEGLPKGDLVESLLTFWSMVPHACLFRRSIIERTAGFPEELFVGEDQVMFLRCLLAGGRVVHSPGTLELYRTNDPGKITAAGSASKARNFRAWALALLMARKECMAKGIDPNEWPGFRFRIWRARRDLKSIGSSETEILDELESLLSGHGGDARYSMYLWIHSKLTGIKFRFTGDREHRGFRSGRATELQRQGVAGMGLEGFR